MFLTMFKSKIHRATVTEANLNYMGSITVDRSLLEAANILPHEKVQIVNNNNGNRFETYTIAGPRDSGVVCLNGAAARMVQQGDTVIIIAYTMLDAEEAKTFQPRIVFLDEKNRVERVANGENHGDIG
ncbi:aspartate 1-decarboxylase [Desulfofarcimen acetoxidans DSM 771]|uniref:Aspartate 1-decarboxylase n=1 Tax=Desulfofarcimen acetoxidans (strain ATCC 49208 / DSM 771 / KCTC 5769 / VKM B-1644 / 5575) TaxID=485916 RepID=C8W3U1_DESAS|nr:aspartate 1-decarboxylase [Desulfofarcimen acetoxidans]ACV61195.1 aspartate 1-decarboxylase [Desulfofarcimen acetoxidans DSM 771]